MHPFVIIVGAVVLGDVAWWLWADRRLKKRTRRPRLWRTLLAIFSGFQLGYMLWFIGFQDAARHAHYWVPAPVLASVYLWHLLILPITLVMVIGERTWALVRAGMRQLLAVKTEPLRDPDPSPGIAIPGLSRRQALASAMVAIPPLLTGGAVSRALSQIHHFRINRIEIPLKQLPPELDGMTIAQVSDIHVGRFTRPGMLPKIADATNSLNADLILLTGDLIDIALSDLPAGIDFVRRLDPRYGMAIIEGNHDLIENPFAFETKLRAAGLPLLLDETSVLYVRGRPIQVMGLSWVRTDLTIANAMERLQPQRREDAFPILLAHHPHAFDPAAAAGIPLTLAGHTHGGQIMLNERLGAGPAMFRYWSGLYRKNDSALFVTNGVGNWFPLRIGAPAEIAHITLRCET
jgi:predicted MPP superfamily phosphohydrolase